MPNVLLISTYELGHQPFGVASPAAWLKEAGAKVTCLDLSTQSLARKPVMDADLVAFYVPMHTATRIAMTMVERVKRLNPRAHLCFYGLYAPMNESLLRKLGAETILGGEFEEGLVALVNRLPATNGGGKLESQDEPLISLARQTFRVPDRSGLPSLQEYAYLDLGTAGKRTAGYTEASRGCKHLCRHCPIVPVYGGKFRIVQQDVVLADIRHQVEKGAQHITFGDPDFFNGPGHAIPIVEALHQEWPGLTYDVTIKIEHLLKHAHYLPLLHETGCAFVTSAVEAIDDHILEIFDKGHTRADFIQVVSLFRDTGITLNPTFVTFTPWTTLEGYLELLQLLFDLELVDNVAPIQYAIRLLIPDGSKLLELPYMQDVVEDFDEEALVYPWTHKDPRVDRLHSDILQVVQSSQTDQPARREVFGRIWDIAQRACGASCGDKPNVIDFGTASPQTPIPHLSEPWYC